ncbi:MAG: SPOR domain-containing protein [Gemmatimonadales bacterium]
MTDREFDHAALADHTVVALVPATGDYEWAAAQAWAVAREASRGKPRVALIDLSLTQPALDTGAARHRAGAGAGGIVDALLCGTSITQVAHPQYEPGLHYVGVGTPTDKAEEVWAHPRWNRLHAGFRSQGALLLLFVPPAAIPHLALQPDGVIILARTGWSQSAQQPPGVAGWLEQGIPLLAVLSEPGSPPEPALPPSVRLAGRQVVTTPRRRGKGNLMFAAAFLVVIGATAVWAAREDGQTGRRAVINDATSRLPVRPSAHPPVVAQNAPTASAVPDGQPERRDTLFYAIQVAAFNTWRRALEYASSLEDRSLAAAITPVHIRGRIWYRVMLGALPSAVEARAALQKLWRNGLVASGEGAILRTPQAFDLGTRPSAETAWEETQRLRERGIPAYSVETSHGAGAGAGAARIFVGAFETPDQTAVVESLLTAAGLTATLVTRTGNAP